jgi:hypothetical protein
MKRVEFYAATNRSGNLLHIETDGCIVNIRVGLADADGRPVTRVDILPDDKLRGDGRWAIADGAPSGIRIINNTQPEEN